MGVITTMIRAARITIFLALFALFEAVAIHYPPVTWLIWEIQNPDTCCRSWFDIVLWPAATVLLTHGAVAWLLYELVRLGVVGVVSFARDPKGAWLAYTTEDYSHSTNAIRITQRLSGG